MKIELYDYQKDCLLAVENDLKNHDSLLAILPMSGGKTTIFTELASNWKKENGSKVLILCDNIKIVDQNMKRMEFMYPDIKVGKLQADNVPAIITEVIYGTIQTCREESKLNQLFGDIGLVVIDESHKSACKSYDTLKELINNAKYVHFTATPYKDNLLMTKMYDKVSYSMSLQQLIDIGRCVKPKMIGLTNFTRELSDEQRIALLTKIYLEREKGNKTAIFMRTINQCSDMRNALVKEGVRAEAIVSKTPESIRERFFYDFEEGDLDVIITCNVISEGYDCPPLEVIFMPFPGTSVANYIQRIGRSLRTFEGKSNARIYAAGSIPSISKNFYKAMREGESESKKFTLKDELSIMDMLDIDIKKDSQSYIWTKKAVEISNLLRGMGKINLSNLLLEKKFPKRLLGNLDLIKLGIDNGDFDDNLDSFNQNVKRQKTKEIMESGEKWILPFGKQQGKHVKDTTYMYRKMHIKFCNGCIICKYIKDWFFYGIRE